jgi:hypothetical protein
MSFEETFALFQKNFEEVTLTLIAAMSKITENLDRVTGAMDLAAKIEIQNIENKQVLQNLEKQFKAVLNRLDKMSRGGFELPEAPTQPIAASSGSMDDIFNATIDKSSEPVDDLEAEFGPLNEKVMDTAITEPILEDNEPEHSSEPAPAPPAPKLPPTPAPPAPKLPPTPAPPAPKLPPTPAPPVPKLPETDEIPIFEEEPPKQTRPSHSGLSPLPPPTPSLSPLPPPPSNLGKSHPPIPSGGIDSPPQPPVKHVEPTPSTVNNRKYGVSNWTIIESPTSGADLLNNLMVEIEDAESLEDIGRKILATKDTLSKKVPFSPAYFEMLMLAGPYANSKGKPNSRDVVQKCFEKIQSWKATFR